MIQYWIKKYTPTSGEYIISMTLCAVRIIINKKINTILKEIYF